MKKPAPCQAIADATAVILAGGKSSRMGRPKALLLFAGEPLIVHIVRALKSMFAEAIVVAAPEQELPPLPATVVRATRFPFRCRWAESIMGSRRLEAIFVSLLLAMSLLPTWHWFRLSYLRSRITMWSCPIGRSAFSRSMRSIEEACCRSSKSSWSAASCGRFFL